ncbi:MAG TPA: hypothetical protein PLU44_16900 [Candidatus Krumholzibacteria bacterium]|nr:hypothetical protein [Candidatus Krumholzibacteria bacterium]
MTLTSRTALDYRADGDQNWGPAHRNVRLMLDRYLCPGNVFFVSPEFSEANLHLSGSPSSRRHFDTIQAAIAAWEAGNFDEQSAGAILVYPGRYAERLTVTRSVRLVAVAGGGYAQDGRGNGSTSVNLRGDGTPSPLVTFDPVDAETHRLVIDGFTFTQAAAAQGSEQAAAMVIDALDQGTDHYGPYVNDVILRNCTGRLDVANLNSWLYGFRIRAWQRLILDACHFTFPGNGAGNYCRYAIYSVGGGATRTSRFAIQNTTLGHPGFASPANYTLYSSDWSSGLVVRSALSRDLTTGRFTSGQSTGISGLTSGVEATAYGNLVSVVAAEW